MKGDFTRFTFDSAKNYIGVYKQQGRVDLDSDWNEQSDIWRENFRRLTRDILGEFAIPLSANEITDDNSSACGISSFTTGPAGVIDFSIGNGLVYLGGYPYVIEKEMTFRTQPDYPEPEIPEAHGDIMIYMEIWVRSVNYIDDEIVREPALGGPDTSLRGKLVGQVKAIACENIESPSDAYHYIKDRLSSNSLSLTIKIDQSSRQIPINFGEVDVSGGLIPGNLHLRLELHRGAVSNGGFSEGFKWSDENAATIVPILKIAGDNTMIVEESEAVTGESLNTGDWVEISNIITELHRQGGQMARIVELTQDETGLTITLDSTIHPLLTRMKIAGKSGPKLELAPRLRRWSGYSQSLIPEKVYDLGRGIKATFHSPDKNIDLTPGDYWTFAIRDRDYNKRLSPQKAAPNGVNVYRHPLAIVRPKGKKEIAEIIDCRRFFRPLGIFGDPSA